MENISSFLLDRYQIDVSAFEDVFLRRTIENRMNASLCKSISDYLQFIRANVTEVALLKGSLTNSYSEFFRNPLTFALLQQVVLPKIYCRRALSDTSEVRIWSAGCAAGQEPYSVAMMAQDFADEHHFSAAIRIFATDVSAEQIALARKGAYEAQAMQPVRLGMINRYFTMKGNVYSVVDRIREKVDFTCWDLLDPGAMVPPASIFGGFDLILCCNVLFYYSPDVQRQIINKLYYALNDEGILVTGEAENGLIKGDHRFRQLSAPASIFYKL